MVREFFGKIAEFLTTGTNAISRRVRVVSSRIRRAWRRPSNDWSRPDYDFWDRAYYCQTKGLEISGLFIKPLVNKIAAWSLGRPPQFKLENETSQAELSDWWNDNHARILKAWQSALRSGDCFIVVNADLSLTLVPADFVDPLVDDDDYSKIIGWRITQTLTHPESIAKQIIIDEYTAERRVQIREFNGRETSRQEFPNLLGLVPVIHVVNNQEPGQTFGHPEAESLIEVLLRYGNVLEAAVDGNISQGRPTPVALFETVQDMEAFWATYGETTSQTLPDGNTEQSTILDIDLTQVLTMSGASRFGYESPGSFMNDTVALLGLLFYLILEHTELPEFVFGNAVTSSHASVETQLPVFIKFIEMKQGGMRGWLIDLVEVVQAYLSILRPGVTDEKPLLQYEPLSDADGNLTLATVQWAFAEGLIDEQTALVLAPIDIEDIPGVLAQAKAETQEARDTDPLTADPMDIFRQVANETEPLEDET